jgi:hypothetical protein
MQMQMSAQIERCLQIPAARLEPETNRSRSERA